MIKKHLNLDRFDIGINYGKITGQIIYHLHIHIVPGYYKIDVSYLQLVNHDLSQKISLKEQKNVIK